MSEKEQKPKVREGIPMNEEELKEWKQSFADIEESISNVMKYGKDIEKSTITK